VKEMGGPRVAPGVGRVSKERPDAPPFRPSTHRSGRPGRTPFGPATGASLQRCRPRRRGRGGPGRQEGRPASAPAFPRRRRRAGHCSLALLLPLLHHRLPRPALGDRTGMGSARMMGRRWWPWPGGQRGGGGEAGVARARPPQAQWRARSWTAGSGWATTTARRRRCAFALLDCLGASRSGAAGEAGCGLVAWCSSLNRRDGGRARGM